MYVCVCVCNTYICKDRHAATQGAHTLHYQQKCMPVCWRMQVCMFVNVCLYLCGYVCLYFMCGGCMQVCMYNVYSLRSERLKKNVCVWRETSPKKCMHVCMYVSCVLTAL